MTQAFWPALRVVGMAAVLAAPAYAETGDDSPRSRMTLTFSEHFADFHPTPVGLPRWRTVYAHGDRTLSGNDELERYTDSTIGPNPFHVSHGVLDITAAPAPADAPLPYTSGLITTERSFTQQYGYFEMRAKLPVGPGLWPAFWLLPADGSWPPEIDGMEMLGSNPSKIFFSIHAKPGGVKFDKTIAATVDNTAADFHSYGVWWQPDMVRWYFDDKEVGSMPSPGGLDQPMYMLINLAVGGPHSWPGAPTAATRFPAHMLVEYVRAYR